MSDMDEQGTLINQSISQDYAEGGKLRKLFPGNISYENISSEGGMKSNKSNNSSIKDSIVHLPKEFPRINPSGSITDLKGQRGSAHTLSTNNDNNQASSIGIGNIPHILYQNKFTLVEAKDGEDTPNAKDDEQKSF